MKLEVALAGGHTLEVVTDDFLTVEVSIGKPTDPETGLASPRALLAFARDDLPQLITALQAVDAAAAWDESRERVMPTWALPTIQWPQADNVRTWERSHRGEDFRMGPAQPVDPGVARIREVAYGLVQAADYPAVGALCALCGKPMPPGEESFRFHGYSGPCPGADEPVDELLKETYERVDD